MTLLMFSFSFLLPLFLMFSLFLMLSFKSYSFPLFLRLVCKIKAVLGMLARGTEARKYGPMAEEAGSAYDCKTKH